MHCILNVRTFGGGILGNYMYTCFQYNGNSGIDFCNVSRPLFRKVFLYSRRIDVPPTTRA